MQPCGESGAHTPFIVYATVMGLTGGPPTEEFARRRADPYRATGVPHRHFPRSAGYEQYSRTLYRGI